LMSRTHLSAFVLMAIALLFAPRAAHAAESYDNCTGFITTIPAVISTQGTWCLKQDLATSISSGTAITINTNNVTIDCNNFKLGGLAAGVSTGATGIASTNRSNITIRHCAIRGFIFGVYTYGGAGHVVEDNRVDLSTTTGLWVDGDNSIVRRNQVTDTGGNLNNSDITGIVVQGDNTMVADNVVTGVTGTSFAGTSAAGIFFNGNSGLLRGNYITNVQPGGGTAYGMQSNNGYLTIVEQNVILNPTATASSAISVVSSPVCLNNRVRNFTVSPYSSCINGGGNFSN